MKMSLIKNRRGDKYLSVYWFVILAIVVAGIFGMVYVYYGSPYDVRQIEAAVLVNKVADCVSYGGRIDSDLISNGQTVQLAEENFLEKCDINFKSEEWEEEQYYTEIGFYRINNLDSPVLKITEGNENWLADCTIQEKKEQKNLPQCTARSFYSIDNANNQYIIKILGVVRKTEKNVKL